MLSFSLYYYRFKTRYKRAILQGNDKNPWREAHGLKRVKGNTPSGPFYLVQIRMTQSPRLHFDHYIILYYIILYYIILYYIILYYIILYYIILYYIILYYIILYYGL
jgi:hypothetical protein